MNQTPGPPSLDTPGETDLRKLMSGMTPVLDPNTFVFVSVGDDQLAEYVADALMVFRESEGVTLILEESLANAQALNAMFRCRRITLQIHSSLDAVGFLAAILPVLARAGMGVNPVSAFFHDHLFIPAERAEEALQILLTLKDQPIR